MKETAKRFKENQSLRLKAEQHDRDLAAKKSNVRIEGDEAIYDNTWTAAGGHVKWDMVHYDVQINRRAGAASGQRVRNGSNR